MRLNSTELQNFINDALNRIHLDLIHANQNDELDKVAMEYGINDLLEEITPSCDFYKANTRRAKILVIAIELPNLADWKMRAKKKGIPLDRIEFQAVKPNFNYSYLANTNVYSDIIVGPVHHKGVGIEDNSSFLAAVANHPEDYPKVHRMVDSKGTLTLSQSAFERCLANTNFMRECL